MTEYTGGEIIARYLVKEGVPYVAGIPGHGCLGLVDAFKEESDKLKVIQVRHEQAACFLADGYYRASGKPLAVFTSIGPGATNTITGISTAYVDSSAMVIFNGEAHTYMFGTGVLQEIERQRWADFHSIARPIVKRSWRVTRVDQLPRVMRRAFNIATSGRPGPVQISLPMDVQAESADVEIPNPIDYRAFSRIRGDPEKIKLAADLLARAERPVILAGGGVIASGASQELVELAELIGAAVTTTMMGRGAIPEDHPLSALWGGSKGTTVGNKVSREADVLLAIGCRFADQTCSSYKPGVTFSIPPTKLIHVDIDPQEIGKNYPVELGIVGDAKTTLRSLTDVLTISMKKGKYTDLPYFRTLQKAKEDWNKKLETLTKLKEQPMTTTQFLKEARKFLDRDAIVVTSAGHAQADLISFPIYESRTNITSGGFSTMGFCTPACIGAKLAKPDKQVIGIEGDGSFFMTLSELATAVQYDVPIVICVLNNYGWLSIRDLQIDVYGKERAYATEFLNDGTMEKYAPDFSKVAETFGCYAERVRSPGEIQGALKRAFESGRPSVVEVFTAYEHPRSEGLATGWWDVPIPTYLKK